jgi:hypothetical protein
MKQEWFITVEQKWLSVNPAGEAASGTKTEIR